MNYAIITPVRDESKYIKHTIESVITQTIKPAMWIIIDDNSSDNTFEIIQRYSDSYEFINPVRIDIETKRIPGKGVIRAFNYGLSLFDIDDYDFIVKLDADLKFKEDYFENIFNEFQNDKILGIASGLILELNGKAVKENIKEHPYGASKVYKVECFKKISPIEMIKTWDLIDNLKANIEGYSTRIIDNEIAYHLKPMESAVGKYRENFLKGYHNAYMSYLKIFAFLKFLKTIMEPPYVLGGLSYLYGYLFNILYKKDFYKNIRVINYLHLQQKKRIKNLLKI